MLIPIMLGEVMLSQAVLSVVILSVAMLSVVDADCRIFGYGECFFAECRYPWPSYAASSCVC